MFIDELSRPRRRLAAGSKSVEHKFKLYDIRRGVFLFIILAHRRTPPSQMRNRL